MGGKVERVMYCFFFNDTATTEIYTLSLHDALPIFFDGLSSKEARAVCPTSLWAVARRKLDQLNRVRALGDLRDRKSTRLNSSHANISYAVFCLKKKNM